tara:strand:- start:1431 stop:1628 length:198 start_codon:yes stop_codon:yes gene_type:complete
MKTSKKEKKFVVEFRQWMAPEVMQEFTTTANSTTSAKSKFEKSYRDYEERNGVKRPFDIVRIKSY